MIYIFVFVAGLVVIGLGVFFIEMLTAPEGFEDGEGFHRGVRVRK